MQKVSAIKKTFHIRELVKVQPLTENQSTAMAAWFSGKHIGLLGCAGTGKTFLGLFLGLHHALVNGSRLIILRSAVPVRSLGHLPGELSEKEIVYERPYMQLCDQLFPYTNCYENLKKSSVVEFYTTSFIRGLTFDNAVVLIDEAQSFNAHELDSVVTRLGDDSRLIICGDGIQTDLRSAAERSGFHAILNILNSLPDYESICFNHADIVRSGFVRDYIIARDTAGLVI